MMLVQGLTLRFVKGNPVGHSLVLLYVPEAALVYGTLSVVVVHLVCGHSFIGLYVDHTLLLISAEVIVVL